MSDDLAGIENRIRGALAGEPPGYLRDRTMQALEAKLAASRKRPANQGNWLWPAIAAVVLMVMNLSFVSASRDVFSLSRWPSGQGWSADIRALQSVSVQQEGMFK